MSTNHTPNYALSQWEATDPVLRADFNADNAKIDAALKAEADARTALASSRNCQAYTTSYAGTGTAGQSRPNSLSFTRQPFFIHVGGAEDPGFSAVYGQTASVSYALGAVRYVRITWSGNRVSWYEENEGYKDSPDHQMNASGQRYTVFALLRV